MSNWFNNKGAIAVILIVVTICLVSLGTKLPSFSGVSNPGTPKPRPRAIIHNPIKTCKQTIDKHHRLVDVPVAFSPTASVRHPESIPVLPPASPVSFIFGPSCTDTISRAPPFTA